MSATSAPRTVACPHCGAQALFAPANPWRPFCSERCRTADLGAWASERFRVPAEAPPEPGGDFPDGSAPTARD